MKTRFPWFTRPDFQFLSRHARPRRPLRPLAQHLRVGCDIALFAIALLMAVPCGAAPKQRAVRAGSMVLTPAPAREFPCRISAEPDLVRSVRLRMVDGKTKREVRFGEAAIVPVGENVEVRYSPVRSGLSVRLRIEPHGRCLVWRVHCRNGGDTQRWLELGPQIVLNKIRGIEYFDGLHDDRPAPTAADGTVEVHNLQREFPLSAVWSARAAVGVGMAPDVVPSYLRHEYQAGPRRAVLAAYTRVVVNAKSAVDTAFVLCAARGEWGKFEVFEAYYDSFPEWFRATPGIDPRVMRAPAEYRAFPCRPWSPEICRRLWAGWDWCYAPFRRTGDIVGRPEFWEYQPARPFGKTRGMPRNKFLAWRRKAFADGDCKCDVAMLFYIPS